MSVQMQVDKAKIKLKYLNNFQSKIQQIILKVWNSKNEHRKILIVLL